MPAKIYFNVILKKILFFPEEDPDGHASKIKLAPHLVFQVIFIGFPDIIGVIAEEGERRHRNGQLSDEFYFNRIASYHRRVITFNGLQHHFI